MSNNKTESTRTMYLLKTEEGYLHHSIDEGLYLDEGERNYSFTENPFSAYDFHSPNGLVPKYLDYTWGFQANTLDEVCKYLNGKIVKIKVTETIIWEEIE